jgi:hypothetical protein
VSDYQPPAATVLDWLRSNLGSRALAPLTGSDTKALRAAVQIMEAWGYDRSPNYLHAFGLCVARMQPQTRELAYHAIAHPLDWSDRARIWSAIADSKLVLPIKPVLTCSFEPGGSHVDHAAEEEEAEAKRMGASS